ncbi:MAG: hypothetical protein H6702_08140 [Myxococcales bacterium]|nr:hypothetical protein [Myxococcales bacterium]
MSDQEREAGGHIGDLFNDEAAVDEFFSPGRALRPPAAAKPSKASKPEHYKVISISLYLDDIERLKDIVKALKAKGHTRANRSLVIREALRQLDLDEFPPQG